MTWQGVIVWLLLVVAAGIAGYAISVTLYQLWDDTRTGRWDEGWLDGWEQGREEGVNQRTMTQNIEVGPRSHRGRCILVDEPEEEEC